MNVKERLVELKKQSEDNRDVLQKDENLYITFSLSEMSFILYSKLEAYRRDFTDRELCMLSRYNKKAKTWHDSDPRIARVQEWVNKVELQAKEFHAQLPD